MSPLTDATLLERCRSGDEDAWRVLIERYGSLILFIPRRHGCKSAVVDDVFAEVCLAMVRSIRTIRDPERLPQWIARTATRATWDVMRRTKSTNLPDLVLQDSLAPPEEWAIMLEEEQIVREALAALPARCRKLLDLLYFAAPSPTYDVVAKEMRMARGSLGPTRRRCLEKMRLHLEPLIDDDTPHAGHGRQESRHNA